VVGEGVEGRAGGADYVVLVLSFIWRLGVDSPSPGPGGDHERPPLGAPPKPPKEGPLKPPDGGPPCPPNEPDGGPPC